MYEWRDKNFIEQMRHEVDPLADDTIADIYSAAGTDIKQVNRLLEHFMTAGELSPPSDMPAELVDHLERYIESVKPPEWTDWGLIDLAGQYFQDRCVAAFTILGCASLPESYAITDATRVLGRSLKLETQVNRRLLETLRFVMEVMKKNGLRSGNGNRDEADGEGIRIASRVRLMHAAMRKLIQEPPRLDQSNLEQGRQTVSMANLMHELEWNDDWGEPIHQIAMSAAIMSFGYVILRCLIELGFRPTRDEQRAYLHRWNVIGHIMGVRDELRVPENMVEAEEMYHAIWEPHRCRTPEGLDLTNVLLEYLEDMSPAMLRHVPRMLMWNLMDRKTCDAIGITEKISTADRLIMPPMMGALSTINYLTQLVYHNVPGAAPLGQLIFSRFKGYFEHMAEKQLGEMYEIVPDMRSAWGFRAEQLKKRQNDG